MALTPGTIVGPYEILGLLGAGGMGEVYRARDTRLNREVALKTLPSTVSGDPDRLARFKREAQLLASLNHPNIGCIHGFEESSGMPALVLELVDGPTLEDRLARGPIPPNEVWPIARQLCDALEAAHERSIIHRDLKPANIKLRPDGTVKVLDFGLAKALDPLPSGPTPDVTMSPTITSPAMTRAGVILGTAAYMSPEQARGATLDARTDVWAFGCVLYEMLSGRRAFPGNTVSDAIAAILEREPVWTALPAATPEPIRRVLRRCLVKDSKQRVRHIADARIEIEEAAAARTDSTPEERQPKPQSTSSPWPIAIAAAAAAAALAAGIVWNIRRPPVTRAESKSVARLVIEPSEQLSTTVENLVAISPDGQRLVYVGGPERRLYVRNLDQFESQPIQGTEGADCPVFSPDGRWLAFIADRKLKKISTQGGTPLPLTDLGTAGSLSWSAGGDTIFFSPGPASGISSVSANSGKPVQVTKLAVNELSHRFPDVLPGGSALLFSDLAGPDDEPIYAQSLKTGERHVLGNGVAARYLPTGHVVYVTGSTLYAVPFDLNRLEATGTPVPLVTNILRPSYSTTPQVSISQTGTLAYLSDNGQREQDALVWVDQRGIESAAGPVGGPYAVPRISPNGQRLAVRTGDPRRNTGDVQIYDFAREYWNRLTGVGEDGPTLLLWTPDGRLTLGVPSKDGWHIYSKSLDGATADEQLLSRPGTTVPLAWSPNGNDLAIVTVTSATGQDVAILDRRHPGTSRAFVNSKAREGAPAFSPDGHWIAYVSDKSGSAEVYLRPYPGPGEEVPVSADGGIEPVWAAKAPVIFYRRDDVMMAVDVVTTPTLSVGKPRRLFERPYAHSQAFWANYDVTADGQRLLMVKAVAPVAPTKINIVLNWFEELKQRVPISK